MSPENERKVSRGLGVNKRQLVEQILLISKSNRERNDSSIRPAGGPIQETRKPNSNAGADAGILIGGAVGGIGGAIGGGIFGSFFD